MVEMSSQQEVEVPVAETELTVEQQARSLIEELSKLDESYFGKNRQQTIRAKIDEITAVLDQKPIDLIQNKKEKVEILFLRGKSLSYMPDFVKAAEEHLSKAHKLMPTKSEPLEALGTIFWKKGDLKQSVTCFEQALENDEKNKDILCKLSMAIRMQTESDEETRCANYDKSIKLATQAIAMDMSDGNSWYVLGNAHLTNFFQNGTSADQLNLALKAYTQAERGMSTPNPDLFANRATVLEYLERYQEAVRDYNHAHSIDQNLGCLTKANRIVDFVVGTARMIVNKIQTKPKHITQMVKKVPTKLPGELRFPNLSYEQAKNEVVKYEITPFAQLDIGQNMGKLISAKVVQHLPKEQELPMCFLLVDSQYNFAVGSFYRTNKDLADKVISGSQIYIKNPSYITTEVDLKGRVYHYKTIKCTTMADVLVNGVSLTESMGKDEMISQKMA